MSAQLDARKNLELRLAEFERLLKTAELQNLRRDAEELLASAPANPRAIHLMGCVERISGRYEKALQLFEQAVALQPDRIETLLEIAAIHRRARSFDRALDALALVLYYEPDNAEAYYEMGFVHRLQSEPERAADCFRKAVDLEPQHAKAHSELGLILIKQERFKEAIELLERAIELDPLNVVSQTNLGYAYVKTEQYERAVSVFAELQARLPPTLVWPKLNTGNAYDHVGRYDLAEKVYEDMLRHEPNNLSAHWNRAHLLLARHDFEAGWPAYENRLQIDGLWKPRLIPFAPWRGEPLEGKSVLVSAEQGLGDQIMFTSCLPELLTRARRVVVECDSRLAALFARSLPGAEIISGQQEVKPSWLSRIGHIDYHIFMASLGSVFRKRLSDFPRHGGYLRADPEKTKRHRQRLDALGKGLKVGLSWRGGTSNTRRLLRSLALIDLGAMLSVPGVHFVSLQYGDCTKELEAARDTGYAVTHWQDAIDDYDETAALCTALDITVSVCTSVIHLNGALGRPVWIMVPAVPEWRYGRSGVTMPWYPSALLFRQATTGNWEPVVDRIALALRERAANCQTA